MLHGPVRLGCLHLYLETLLRGCWKDRRELPSMPFSWPRSMMSLETLIRA